MTISRICSEEDEMVVRKIIRIDEELCDGCGKCIIACAEGALKLVDGKAKVIDDKFCDGLGACIGECPTGALTIDEREADEFDEQAVREHTIGKTPCEHEICCPSAKPTSFESRLHASEEETKEQKSMLSHWPIKLMLVPENADFLRGRDLVVLADCAAAAYGDLQMRVINGNAVIMGCPKFDRVDVYRKKLVGMIRNAGLRSISVVHMEVPCCHGLDKIVSEALEESGIDLPIKRMVIGIRGDLK